MLATLATQLMCAANAHRLLRAQVLFSFECVSCRLDTVVVVAAATVVAAACLCQVWIESPLTFGILAMFRWRPTYLPSPEN